MKNADAPAMPTLDWEHVENHIVPLSSGGLTKREHFLAMAMQGLLANGSFHYLEVPGIAIRVADLQLEELVR